MSLEIQGLARRVGGFELRANLKVSAGERLAITGPSGSGKTTFLRLVAGLEPLDAGRILLDGTDITRLPPHRRGIGYVFQDPSLIPSLSVLENAAFGLRMRGAGKAERRAAVMPWLERVGMGGLAERSVHDLSGGERSRVAFVRALVWKPALVLLDEPFAALDPALRQGLRERLQELHRLAPVPLLLVTHDREDVRAVATAEAGIRGENGPVRELLFNIS